MNGKRIMKRLNLLLNKSIGFIKYIPPEMAVFLCENTLDFFTNVYYNKYL